MKVFMYGEIIVNLEAVEKVETSPPDKKSGTQSIWFHLRNDDSTRITVPTSETKKILKNIYDEMIRGD